MLKTLVILCGVLTIALAEDAKKPVKYVDPFTALDRHITHTLAYHYLWPWNQLVRAAAALDAEENLEEPQIVSDKEKFQVNLNVKRFKPDELKVRVKNRNIVVEGKHKETRSDIRFMTNHFVQRFILPPGSRQEEVTAVLKENGYLSITVPKHDVPPPPPEREVPIEVRLPQPVEKETEKEEEAKVTEKVEVVPKEETPLPSLPTSSATPLEQLDLVEATTHAGKIRKKELKNTTKMTKDNEVTKGVDSNGLDYALIESE